MNDAVAKQQGYTKVEQQANVWKHKESGLYYAFIDNTPYLIHDLAVGEAAEHGVLRRDFELYKGENEKIIAARKKAYAQQQAKLGEGTANPEPAAPLREGGGRPACAPASTEVHYEVPVGGADLVPVAGPRDIVFPIAPVERVVAMFNAVQEIKSRVLSKDDFVTIGKKDVIRKTGWRKLKVCFGLDQQLVREERRDLGEGEFEYTAFVRVTAPNGTYCEAKSSASTIEPFGLRQKAATRGQIKDPSREVKPEMIVYAIRGMAQTRAYNRAISDLIGGGEDSAEELDGEQS